MSFCHYIPTRILFGRGAINRLEEENLPGQKVLIVISRGGSMRRFGYLSRLEALLHEKGIDSIVFDEIEPNPTREQVMNGAALARTEGCDIVIGLGGGSSIDAAKAIAVMTCNPGDLWDYIASGSGKGKPVLNGALPLIAITTTAGTGTEADPWAVISSGNEKIGFGNPDYSFPILSIVDPELMLTVPPQLTAFQGFDALFHAAEGFIATLSTPISDLYALESIRLLSKYLPRAVADGKNLDAREKVALANTLSGMVESTSGCISQHALEHALSGFHPELPHGAGLIMLSESYFSHFQDIVPERFDRMAKAMKAPSFIEGLLRLQKQCNVYDLKMESYGITETELPELALHARKTMGILFEFDPAPLSDEESLQILQSAWRK